MSVQDVANVRLLIKDDPQFTRTVVVADIATYVFRSDLWPVIDDGSINVYSNGTLLAEGAGPGKYTVVAEQGLIKLGTAASVNDIITIEASTVFFSDAKLQAFVDFRATADSNQSNIFYAAADALDAMASRVAMVQKRLETLDIKTDGPALAKSLRDHAKALRADVRAEIEDLKDESAFGIAEEVYNAAGYRQKIWNDFVRGSY